MYKYNCTNEHGVRFTYRCNSIEEAYNLLVESITKYSFNNEHWTVEQEW